MILMVEPWQCGWDAFGAFSEPADMAEIYPPDQTGLSKTDRLILTLYCIHLVSTCAQLELRIPGYGAHLHARDHR